MILIEKYQQQGRFIMCSLSNDQIRDLAVAKTLPISRVYDDFEFKKPSHWIAEPSALTFLEAHCGQQGHVFKEVA